MLQTGETCCRCQQGRYRSTRYGRHLHARGEITSPSPSARPSLRELLTMKNHCAVAAAGGGWAAERWSSPRVSVAAARATAARAAARAAAARAVAVRAAARAVAAKAAVARAWIQVHVASLAGPKRSLDAVCTAALHARSDAALDATASLFLQLAAQERALAPPQAAAASGAHAEGCGPHAAQATEVAQAAEAALFEGDALCTERLPAASASGLHDAASLFLQLAPGDCTQALAAPPTPAARPNPVAPQTPGLPGARIISTSRDYHGAAAAAAALTPTVHTCERSRRGRAGSADAGHLTISVSKGRRPSSVRPYSIALAPRPFPLTPLSRPSPLAPPHPSHPHPSHPRATPSPTRCPTRSNAVALSRRSRPPPPTRRAAHRRGAAGLAAKP